MLYVFGSSKREITILEGDVLFIPAGTAYTAYYTEDSTVAIQAQFDLVFGSLPYSLREPAKPNIPDVKSLMLSLVDKTETPENLTEYTGFTSSSGRRPREAAIKPNRADLTAQ